MLCIFVSICCQIRFLGKDLNSTFVICICLSLSRFPARRAHRHCSRSLFLARTINSTIIRVPARRHKCIHRYVHQCLRYMYVIREIQVCLCVCMYMHVCMHLHMYTHIHTCAYVCMCTALMLACQNKHDSAACMHACMYVYVYTCRCKYIYIKIFKRSKQMNFRQAKTLFTCVRAYMYI